MGVAMKNGAAIKALEELCEFRNGLWKGKKPPYVHVGVIRNTNFNADGSLDETDIAFLDVEAKQFKNRQLEFGDIILEKSGGGPKQPVGRVITFEKQNGQYSFSNFTSIIRISNPGELDYRFLHRVLYWYYTSGVTEGMQRRSTGIRNLDFNAYKQLQIPVPPLPEQRRIVGILDEAFAGIATAKANAEQNLQNARALFESQLDTVFSSDGRGWGELIALETVLAKQPRNGWSPPAKYQTGSGVPVLTLSAVTGFEYNGSKVKLSSAPTREDAHYWLETGELLITRSNTRELVGHVAIYDGTPTPAICCDLIMKMKVESSKALTKFLYYYIRSPKARDYLTTKAHGASSTMKKIGKKVVQEILIPLPSIEQQASVVDELDSIKSQSESLASIYRRKLVALDELKKSLLHQAFSGKL